MALSYFKSGTVQTRYNVIKKNQFLTTRVYRRRRKRRSTRKARPASPSGVVIGGKPLCKNESKKTK